MRKLTLTQIARMALRRSGAYKRLFLTNERTLNEDAQTILADLKRFCRADGTSTFVGNDPAGRTQALLEGRREVFERIRAYIEADDSTIHRLQEQVPQD